MILSLPSLPTRGQIFNLLPTPIVFGLEQPNFVWQYVQERNILWDQLQLSAEFQGSGAKIL